LTATLPVILTVGKLEPYRPEDGEHVRSNAVIVKPFAAAELISAVRSLIGAPTVEPVGESQAADMGTDPLQESAVAESVVSTESVGFAQPAPKEGQSARLSEAGIADEPLFSYGSSAALEDSEPLATPSATQGKSVYAAEPFPESDFDAPQGLVFNPDSEHTPFSASAIDPLPSMSHSGGVNGASAFTEFDLEPEEPSDYSPLPELETSATKQPLPVPETTGLTSSESFDASSVDPLFEVADEEAPTLSVLEEEKAPGEIAVEGETTTAQGSSTSATTQPSQDEEARRAAFDALFESTEPFPVEDSPAAATQNYRLGTLPSMADLSKDQPYEVAADSEIEHLDEDSRHEAIAQEPDPFLMEEEGPLSATVAMTRDPGLMLEDAGATNGEETPSMLGDAEIDHAAQGETYLPKPDETSDLAPTPVEARLDSDEAVPAVTETRGPAPSEIPLVASEVRQVQVAPEVMHSALEHSVESAPAVTETLEQVHSEMLPVAPQVGQVQVVPEVVHSASELAVEAAPAMAETFEEEPLEVMPVVPEVKHVQAVPEIMHSAVQEVVPEPVRSEAESAAAVEDAPLQLALEPAFASALPELVQTQAETHVAVLSAAAVDEPQPSAVVASEVERIQLAVQKVFDRFKPLLVAAIVRELGRRD
jgi:hypothetical protein